MSIEKIIIKPTSNFERKTLIYPHLQKKVFHFTKTQENYEGIIKDNSIKNNRSGDFSYTREASAVSYGNYKGYVSVFNLSLLSDDQVFGKDSIGEEDSIHGIIDCLNFFEYDYFFIFKDKIIPDLIDCNAPKMDGHVGKIHIPHAEYYYNDAISLDLVEKILIVDNSGIIPEKTEYEESEGRDDPLEEFIKKIELNDKKTRFR